MMSVRVMCAMAIVILGLVAPAWSIEVIAHRGAHRLAPENTRAAAQQCIDLGVDWLEVDVAPSKDGVLYNLHDLTVSRTTNGKGALASLMSAQVDALDAGSWFGAQFAQERIPRYDTFLPWLKGKIKVNFDVKFVDPAALIALVRANGLERDSFFHFASPALALRFHALAPDLTVKVDVSTPEEAERAATVFGARMIETGLPSLTPAFWAVCRQHGLKVICCAQTNEPDEYRKIIDSGADMAMVDAPDVFLHVAGRR